MILMALIRALCGIVKWFLGSLPRADLGVLASAITAAASAVGVFRSIDAYVPASEGLAAMTIYMGIYVAIHGFNAVRRVFSLIWPGAGG